MSTDERTQHFAGFAKALGKELYDNGLIDLRHAEAFSAEELVTQIIAHRAYDLAMHVIDSLSSYDYDVEPYKVQLIKRVPDLPRLPEVKE